MREYPSLAPSQAEKQVVLGDDTAKQVCPEPGLQYLEIGRLEVADNPVPYIRESNSRKAQGSIVCGLRRRTFNVLCLVCTLFFIGIGAASGASAAITRDSNSKLSQPTSMGVTASRSRSRSSLSFPSIISSMTSTRSSASTVSSITPMTSAPIVSSLSKASAASSAYSSLTSAAYNCPSDTNTTYNPSNTTLVFQKVCDTDWRKGDPGIKGGLVADIGNFLVYTIDECIDICVNLPVGGCTAVCYWGNTTLALSQGFAGNCWLKNQRALQSWTPDWQQEGAYLM